MRIYFFIISLSFVLTSCGEKNYSDCVLEHSKEMKSDEAVSAITMACYEKYGEKNPKSSVECTMRDVTVDELIKLDGSGSIVDNKLSATIYNGNSDITIKNLTVVIKYKNKEDWLTYSANLKIPPNSAGDLDIKVLPKKNNFERFSWDISSAKTCK